MQPKQAQQAEAGDGEIRVSLPPVLHPHPLDHTPRPSVEESTLSKNYTPPPFQGLEC